MATIIKSFERAGVTAVKPKHHKLGTFRQQQYLGSCIGACDCGETHTYDLYVDFCTQLRGGWTPVVYIRHDRGMMDRRLSQIVPSIVDYEVYKIAVNIITEEWWTIYNRTPQGDVP